MILTDVDVILVLNRNKKCKAGPVKQERDSAVGLHLPSSNECKSNYSKDFLRLLSGARSAFYRTVLEAVLINLSNPSLCGQREFVFAL